MTSHSQIECPRPVVFPKVRLGTFRDHFPIECPRPVVVTKVRLGTFRDHFPIKCPRPVDSSSVPPPHGFQLSAPSLWIPSQCPRHVTYP